jgi:hypothetical protein
MTESAAVARLTPGELGEFDVNVHDWNTLMTEAVDLGGADLLGKELIDELVGVPHCIVGVDFRQGEKMKNGHDGAYVSLTAIIAPDDVLLKRKIAVEVKPFDAEDLVVYNDGSTGVYRQVVKVLHDKGYIALPDPVIVGGGSGESSYDLHPVKWTGVDAKRVRSTLDENGDFKGIHAAIRINAPRGIRYSEYDGPEGATRTRYIG